jgi:hypothetical protein
MVFIASTPGWLLWSEWKVQTWIVSLRDLFDADAIHRLPLSCIKTDSAVETYFSEFGYCRKVDSPKMIQEWMYQIRTNPQIRKIRTPISWENPDTHFLPNPDTHFSEEKTNPDTHFLLKKGNKSGHPFSIINFWLIP